MPMSEDLALPNKLSAHDNATLELKHIELELINNRTQHLRHFVDQYYCYSHGYINKNGGADWSRIFWDGYVSEEASLTEDKKMVVKEHVVPLKIITGMLFKLVSQKKVSTDAIQAILDKYLLFATITKDEDKRIRKNKLNSNMPECFIDGDCIQHTDLFCRYIHSNILMHPYKTRFTEQR